MFRFSKAKKKQQEAALNKFFASWLWRWYNGISRVLVPKKPKQNGGLKWKSSILRRYAMLFPVSRGFSGIRQAFSTNTWPTYYRHAANSRLTVGRKFSQKVVNDSWPTVSQQFLGGAVFHFFQIQNTYSNFNQISTWLIQIMKWGRRWPWSSLWQDMHDQFGKISMRSSLVSGSMRLVWYWWLYLIRTNFCGDLIFKKKRVSIFRGSLFSQFGWRIIFLGN